MGGRAQRQKFAVVGQLYSVGLFEGVQRKRKGHFAIFVVVAIGFTVGGDVYELGTVAIARKAAKQAFGQFFALVEEFFKRDGARRFPIVKEHGNASPRRKNHIVGHRGVHFPTPYIGVSGLPTFSYSLGLIGGQDGETDAVLGECLEAGRIDGGFGKPHSLGESAKTGGKIAQAPQNLRLFVALVAQRQDGVVVDLRQRRAVAGKTKHALLVGKQNGFVHPAQMCGHPRQQRRAVVETDALVVADDVGDAALAIQDARKTVGLVALGADAFIPIVIGEGAVLDFDGAKPRIFAGRLVEMTVDANKTRDVFHREKPCLDAIKAFAGFVTACERPRLPWAVGSESLRAGAATEDEVLA